MSDMCHYITVRDVGRILIPGCWAVAVSDDISLCTCNAPLSDPEQIDKLQQENKRLREENKRLKALLNSTDNKTNKKVAPESLLY